MRRHLVPAIAALLFVAGLNSHGHQAAQPETQAATVGHGPPQGELLPIGTEIKF